MPWFHFLIDPPPVLEYAVLGTVGGSTAVMLAWSMFMIFFMPPSRIRRLSLVVVAAATAYALIHIQLVLVRTRNVYPGDLAGFILFLLSTAGSIASAALSIDAVCDAIEIHRNPKLEKASHHWVKASWIVAFVWALSVLPCGFLPAYFCLVVYLPFALFSLFVHRRIYRELQEMHDSVIAATTVQGA